MGEINALLRDFNLVSVFFRLVLAAVLSGLLVWSGRVTAEWPASGHTF